jgi:hypothetical protein
VASGEAQLLRVGVKLGLGAAQHFRLSRRREEERQAKRPHAKRWQGSRGASLRAAGAGEEGQAAEAARTCYPRRVRVHRELDGKVVGAPSGPPTWEKKGGPPRPCAPATLVALKVLANQMARQPGRLCLARVGNYLIIYM